MTRAWVYIMANRPDGTPRAWKVRLLAAQNPKWDDLYRSLISWKRG